MLNLSLTPWHRPPPCPLRVLKAWGGSGHSGHMTALIGCHSGHIIGKLPMHTCDLPATTLEVCRELVLITVSNLHRAAYMQPLGIKALPWTQPALPYGQSDINRPSVRLHPTAIWSRRLRNDPHPSVFSRKDRIRCWLVSMDTCPLTPATP